MVIYDTQVDWRKNNPIKLFREERNMTQGQLTEMLGIGKNVVASWEKGRSFPGGDNLMKLQSIGFDASLLLEWKKAKPII